MSSEDRFTVLELREQQKENLSRLDADSTFPTVQEIKGILEEDNYSEKIQDVYSSKSLLCLLEKLKLCCLCRRTNICSDYFLCDIRDGCYLETLGLLEKAAPGQKEVNRKAVCSGLYISTTASLLLDLLSKQIEVSEQLNILEEQRKGIDEDKKYLEEEKKILKEKKSKLGRPSKMESRKIGYEIYWVNAPEKPSYNELAKLLGVSPATVCRDLKKLGLDTEKSTP